MGETLGRCMSVESVITQSAIVRLIITDNQIRVISEHFKQRGNSARIIIPKQSYMPRASGVFPAWCERVNSDNERCSGSILVDLFTKLANCFMIGAIEIVKPAFSFF